jgi:hypothetical protein
MMFVDIFNGVIQVKLWMQKKTVFQTSVTKVVTIAITFAMVLFKMLKNSNVVPKNDVTIWPQLSKVLLESST